jgi:hypothetical protein
MSAGTPSAGALTCTFVLLLSPLHLHLHLHLANRLVTGLPPLLELVDPVLATVEAPGLGPSSRRACHDPIALGVSFASVSSRVRGRSPPRFANQVAAYSRNSTSAALGSTHAPRRWSASSRASNVSACFRLRKRPLVLAAVRGTQPDLVHDSRPVRSLRISTLTWGSPRTRCDGFAALKALDERLNGRHLDAARPAMWTTGSSSAAMRS